MVGGFHENLQRHGLRETWQCARGVGEGRGAVREGKKGEEREEKKEAKGEGMREGGCLVVSSLEGMI
jgi:hypothetical protein